MKAREKPVEIECFEFDGDLVNAHGQFYVPDFAESAYNSGILFYREHKGSPGELFVKTLEGDMHVSVGDYVIQGVNGWLYPCKPDIFKKTYDLI